MPIIKTGDRVAVKVTKNGDGNWQVVSAPTGFFSINSALFSDNDFIHGYVVFESGTDFEVYDTDGSDTSTLLQILNITGTVIIRRPATPYASTNGGNRVTNDTGTHTLAIQLGAGTLKRIFRETNPTWKTLISADSTPDVSSFKLFKTNGTTTITRFDEMEDGKVFYVERGASDITIQHSSDVVLPGATDLTLTENSPFAAFIEDSGSAYCFAVASRPIKNIMPNVVSGDEKAIASGVFVPDKYNHIISSETGTTDSVTSFTTTGFPDLAGGSILVKSGHNITFVHDGSAVTTVSGDDIVANSGEIVDWSRDESGTGVIISKRSAAASGTEQTTNQVTDAQLADISHTINTGGKGLGKQVIETTNNRVYFSTGSAAESAWRPFDDQSGFSDITPA